MTNPSSRRRRLLGQTLAGAPLLVTAIRNPVLAAVPQTASAYGSVLASAQTGQQLQTYSNPFTLSAAVAELRAAMDAQAKKLSSSSGSGGLLGGLTSTVLNLLNTLLNAVSSLFTGKSTVAQLQKDQPALYDFLVTYRSAMWPVSPAAPFSPTIGNLQNFGTRTLLDVAVDSTAPLGQYFVASFLNASSAGRIDPLLLNPQKVKTIAYELNSRGFFEPTAGVRWDSGKVVEWWRLSLGVSL